MPWPLVPLFCLIINRHYPLNIYEFQLICSVKIWYNALWIFLDILTFLIYLSFSPVLKMNKMHDMRVRRTKKFWHNKRSEDACSLDQQKYIQYTIYNISLCRLLLCIKIHLWTQQVKITFLMKTNICDVFFMIFC